MEALIVKQRKEHAAMSDRVRNAVNDWLASNPIGRSLKIRIDCEKTTVERIAVGDVLQDYAKDGISFTASFETEFAYDGYPMFAGCILTYKPLLPSIR